MNKFSEFDPKLYQNLRTLYHRVKAKICIADRKLETISNHRTANGLQKTKDVNAAKDMYDESIHNQEKNSQSPVTSSSNDKTYSTEESFQNTRNLDSLNPSNEEVSNNSQDGSLDSLNQSIDSCNEAPSEMKKSCFKLKRPVKAILDPVASKQIETIFKKIKNNRINNNNDSLVNLNASISQPHNLEASTKNIVEARKVQSQPEDNGPRTIATSADDFKTASTNAAGNCLLDDYELMPELSSWSDFGKFKFHFYS